MTYKAKKYYQDKTIADNYFEKRFKNIPGIINHFLEKTFLINSIKNLEINSALDVACGTGRMTKELLSQNISKVTGVDISQEMLVNAKKYCGIEEGITFQLEDATDLSFKDKSFDLCITFRFLDHLPEEDKLNALKEMIRCSKKYVVFTMANVNFWTTIARNFRKLLNKKYYEGYLVDEAKIKKFLELNNMNVIKCSLKFPILSMETLYFCEKN